MILLLAAAQVMSAGRPFNCTPIAVWDGDGPIWCAEGPKIRLHGIAAREVKRANSVMLDAGCKPGHPCPNASGVAARDQLVKFLGGPRGMLSTGHIRVAAPRMRCLSYGSAKGSRTDASCTLSGVGDLSCAMVKSGAAIRWRAYGGDQVCRRMPVGTRHEVGGLLLKDGQRFIVCVDDGGEWEMRPRESTLAG